MNFSVEINVTKKSQNTWGCLWGIWRGYAGVKASGCLQLVIFQSLYLNGVEQRDNFVAFSCSFFSFPFLFSFFFTYCTMKPTFSRPFPLLLTVSSTASWKDHTLKIHFDPQFKYMNFIYFCPSFWSGRILEILQSDWFRKQVVFYNLAH